MVGEVVAIWRLCYWCWVCCMVFLRISDWDCHFLTLLLEEILFLGLEGVDGEEALLLLLLLLSWLGCFKTFKNQTIGYLSEWDSLVNDETGLWSSFQSHPTDYTNLYVYVTAVWKDFVDVLCKFIRLLALLALLFLINYYCCCYYLILWTFFRTIYLAMITVTPG